jgi:hypothetical protein
MRNIGLMCTILVVACFNPTNSYGQGGEQQRSEEQSEPYHKHHDTRHGHNHIYPDRGAIVRDLPKGTIGISHAGVSYRYHDGIWLEPRGPAYMVVAPPIGLVAPTLPLFSTVVTHGGETYLYANGTYYRPRPDLGGYEVANEPVDESPQAAPEALVGGQLPGALAATPPAIPTATSAVITPGLPVPVASGAAGAAATPATAQAAPGSISTQAASSLPPASASMTAVTPPATGTTSTPATTANSAAVPVAVPAGTSPPGTQKGPKVFLYPKNGQTPDQQARDRYECYRFAVAQSGFDPMRSNAGTSPAPAGEMQSDYERAQSACFEARGYSSR